MDITIVVFMYSSIMQNLPIMNIRDKRHAYPFANMISMIHDDFPDEFTYDRLTYDEIDHPAWVLIFDRDTAMEGIYCVENLEKNTSSVLAFEHSRDAHSFANHLTTKGLSLSTPLRWSADMISFFCEAGGFQVIIVENLANDKTRNDLNRLFLKNPDNCADDDCTT